MSQPDELRRLLRRLEHQRDKALRAEVKSDELYELYDADNEGHEGEYVAALVTLTSERSELADMATSAVPQFRAAADRIERLDDENSSLAAALAAASAQQAAALALIDRCYECDLPLLHDENEPQLAWWCEGCGLITTVPDTIRRALTEDTP